MADSKTILVVDDEPTHRQAVVTKLQKEGFAVEGAADGAEGLRRAEELKPDLILLDVVMPNMDGITMLHTIRATDWGANIPVLVLTNLSEVKTAMEGEKIEDYLVKADWKLQDVVDKAKEILAR